MSSIWVVALELGALAWVLQGFLRRSARGRPERKAVPFEKLLLWVRRYGRNSNSFMTLYPGFEYFESSDPALEGAIAYADTTHAWVIGAEPLSARESQIKLLDEFARAAEEQGKRVLLIPADLEFAERAEKAGFRAILVGSEPTFVLAQYPVGQTKWLDVVPAARQFAAKGAAVREVPANELTEELRAELDPMTEAWLGTRKTATLGFLNQVHPWRHSELKKYFIVEQGGRVLAFLAAIPVQARNAWYLIDTIRREDSPSGTTELLLLEAMRILKEQGAEEVTFGVAPLSGIDAAASIPVAHAADHRILYKILGTIFEKGNQFYNFKPLFTYKMKFQPTTVRPVFLLYRGLGARARLSLKDIVSISQAWLPLGIAHATGLGLVKLVSRLSLPDLIKSQLRPGTIVRSVPPSWVRLISRCRVTALLVFASIVASIAAMIPASFGATDAGTTTHWAFHLLGLVVFTGGLEYLAGSTIAALCFFIPFLLSSLVFTVLAHPFSVFDLLLEGSALGILGTAGGLYWFIRNAKIWLTALALISTWGFLIAPLDSASWIRLDRWIAIVLGILIGKIALRT